MSRESDRQDQQMLDAPTARAQLEASAIVASKVSREESRRVVRLATMRTMFREGMIAGLVVAVALLVLYAVTQNSRTKAAVLQGQQINCKLDRDVSKVPLGPSSKITATGLTLIADFRNGYYAAMCEQKLGPLPKPDPRLLPYLDTGAKN